MLVNEVSYRFDTRARTWVLPGIPLHGIGRSRELIRDVTGDVWVLGDDCAGAACWLIGTRFDRVTKAWQAPVTFAGPNVRLLPLKVDVTPEGRALVLWALPLDADASEPSYAIGATRLDGAGTWSAPELVLVCATPSQILSCEDRPADTICTIPDSAYTATAPPIPDAPSETPPVSTTSTDLPLFANALVYSPFHRRIYASVPGIQGANGNSIAVIDGSTASVERYVPIGSEPSALALSDDGFRRARFQVLNEALVRPARTQKFRQSPLLFRTR